VNHSQVCEVHAPERVGHSPARGGQMVERKAATSRGETSEGGGEVRRWGEMTERDRSSLEKTKYGLQIISETEDGKAMDGETESGGEAAETETAATTKLCKRV
jgi:hypothetical protein